MSEHSLSPKRARLDFDESSVKEEHFDKYKGRDRDKDHDDQSNFSHSSHSKHRKRAEASNAVAEEEDNKDEDGKAKPGGPETARREHTLVMRLTNKEQELQDCMNQIQEMKQAQTQNTAQLRSMLLDPAINLVFQRMAKEMDDHKDKLKQKQNELTAWKFTPDSQTGMRVMARCRMLLQENQELGKMISSGRTARLEGEIVLHKALATEMKKNQKELDEFVGELEEDVEGMQGMIFMLRQQLKEAQEQIARLQAENEQLRTLSIPPDPEPGGSSLANSGTNTPLHTWSDAEPAGDAAPHSKQTGAPSSPTAPTSAAQPVESGSPLSAADGPHQDHLLSVAQPYEDFNSAGAFASKVTPDSGVHTQEEDEETSMDTSELSSAAASARTVPQQQPVPTCDQLNNGPVAADSTVEPRDSSASDGPFVGQQAAEKKADLTAPTPSEVSSSFKSEDCIPEADHLRTTSVSSPTAADSVTNSTDCPSSHGSPPSPRTRTHDSAELDGTDTQCEGTPQAQASNSETPARTNQSLTHPGDGAIKAEMPTDDQGGVIQEDNKVELHASLGLGINPKTEEDKVECALGLVNGSAKTHN